MNGNGYDYIIVDDPHTPTLTHAQWLAAMESMRRMNGMTCSAMFIEPGTFEKLPTVPHPDTFRRGRGHMMQFIYGRRRKSHR